MSDQLTYFLLVAEELNMRRAAERAYISHQGISAAIKQLEREYGVPLFYRTPRLSLTPQGKMLVQAVRQIKIIEDNLAAMLNESSEDFQGKLSIGVPRSRYDVIVPDLVGEFKKSYKNVELEIISDSSRYLEQRVENNELDMSINTGSIDSPDLTILPLFRESFVLLISEAMLCRHFPENTHLCIQRFRKQVALKEFETVPFISYPHYSQLSYAIARYTEEKNIHLHTVFETDRGLSIGPLCQRGVGMGIVSSLFLPSIHQANRYCHEEEYLYAFPLEELPYCKMLNLIYRKDRYLTKCHRDLIQIISRTFAQYEKSIRHMLQ